MKTHKNLFQQVYSLENLYNSYLKAKKGKSNLTEVVKFDYNLEEELFNLQYELKSQTYKTGKYRHFIILEPKKRKISALPFRDRIVHHAVCSVINPIFEKKFIHDSYACRKQKGTHAGIVKIQSFIKKTDNNFYVLKCDVSKYFSSVDHKILKKLIREKIQDEKLLFLIDNIIDSSNEKISPNSFGKGIPIGNLTSQLFANIYLNKLDEHIKYELKIKYYIRYMDDFIIIHKSKKHLHHIKEQVKIFFTRIKLNLHPKKRNIFPIYLGVDFLGYVIFKEYRRVRKSTVKRFLIKIKIKIKLYDTDYISYEKLMESFNSWNAYLSHGNTYNLKRSLREKYFKNLA